MIQYLFLSFLLHLTKHFKYLKTFLKNSNFLKYVKQVFFLMTIKSVFFSMRHTTVNYVSVMLRCSSQISLSLVSKYDLLYGEN